MKSILIIDDIIDKLDLLKKAIKDVQINEIEFNIETALGGEKGLEKIKKNWNKYDLIFLDIDMPGKDGFKILQEIQDFKKKKGNSPPIVAYSHSILEPEDVEMATGLGAKDYLQTARNHESIKSFLKYYLKGVLLSWEEIDEVLNKAYSSDFWQRFEDTEKKETRIIGRSNILRETLSKAIKIGKNDHDSNIYIFGESGTGKEAISRLITFLGIEFRPVYREINAAEIAVGGIAGLIKVNGCVPHYPNRGDSPKIGLLEAANQGVLYLNEIGRIDPEISGYLLTAMEQKYIIREGDPDQLHRNADFRLISASNIKIEDEAFLGRLGKQIHVPSLKERGVLDLDLLSDYLMPSNIQLTLAAKGRLYKCDWPSNVRGLKSIISLAIDLCQDNYDYIPKEIIDSAILDYKRERDMLSPLDLQFPIKNNLKKKKVGDSSYRINDL